MRGALVAIAAVCCHAGNNGEALTPVMSWRSWNNYDWHINASVMLGIAKALVDTSRPIIGRPQGTSLRDLGYSTVGMDEGWAACGPFPSGNWAYHRSNGDGTISPVVNESLFPDMGGMVDAIHSLGLSAGWYLNDCLSYCFELGDTCGDECNEGDVAAFTAFGFDSLKLDGCSKQVSSLPRKCTVCLPATPTYLQLFSTTCRCGHHFSMQRASVSLLKTATMLVILLFPSLTVRRLGHTWTDSQLSRVDPHRRLPRLPLVPDFDGYP